MGNYLFLLTGTHWKNYLYIVMYTGIFNKDLSAA